MLFRDIIGQEEAKRRLVSAADSGRISHAMLFTGRSGYGVLPLMIAYAQYINCTARGGGDSCGECPSCKQMASLAHPDVHYVFPVNNPTGKSSSEKPVSDLFIRPWRELVLSTGGYFDEAEWYAAIGIDNKQGNISRHEAEEITRKLSFKAFESEYKIVIMWLPERMNIQAANALLKILEEPWEKTLFLMGCEAPGMLLPTILSRTQSFEVGGIDERSLSCVLEAQGPADPDTAARMARLSGGDLLTARAKLSSDDEGDEAFDLFVELMRLSYEDKHLELMTWAENMSAMGREEQKRTVQRFVELLRESYMLCAGMDSISTLAGKQYAWCRKFAPYVNNTNIESLVAETELVLRHLLQNGNQRIIFTHYALTVSKMIRRI